MRGFSDYGSGGDGSEGRVGAVFGMVGRTGVWLDGFDRHTPVLFFRVFAQAPPLNYKRQKRECVTSQTTISLDPNELKVLVRLLHAPVRSILEDWRQQGPDDPAEDELLLNEALAVLQKYENQPDAWSNGSG